MARQKLPPSMVAFGPDDQMHIANQYEGRYDPMQELQRIQQSYRTNPGRAEGGTGVTGLTSGDSRGWNDLLSERRRYAQLLSYLGQ
jgi:hypothetical protein